jgi:hypothetical protein
MVRDVTTVRALTFLFRFSMFYFLSFDGVLVVLAVLTVFLLYYFYMIMHIFVLSALTHNRLRSCCHTLNTN